MWLNDPEQWHIFRFCYAIFPGLEKHLLDDDSLSISRALITHKLVSQCESLIKSGLEIAVSMW